ncbi:MAG TPA: hypothetical protein V6C86_09440 [Oculatellaceae cyanobacterium]
MGNSPLFWIVDGLAVAAVSALTIYSAVARKGKGRFLCDDCRFNDPEKCKKVERPRALVCTSYRSEEIREIERVRNLTTAPAAETIIMPEERQSQPVDKSDAVNQAAKQADNASTN